MGRAVTMLDRCVIVFIIMAKKPGTITRLLMAWSNGDERALEELMRRVYDYLRGMAANHLRDKPEGHTLQTIDLVNEAYLRIVDQTQVDWKNRSHFYAIAARMMRRVMQDNEKFGGRLKRDRSKRTLLLPEDFEQLSVNRPEYFVAIDDALDALAEHDPEAAELVVMRFFGGMTQKEISEVLGIAEPTVKRRWRRIKAWLYNFLVEGDDDLI